MRTKPFFFQGGATLVGLLVGSALLAVMVASTIRMSAFGRAGPSSDQSLSPPRQSLLLSDRLADLLALGGGYVSTSDADKGIQMCALSEQGSHCGRFTNQYSRFCVAFPSRVGGNDASTMNVNGVRLFAGVLYERKAIEVDLNAFDVSSFCASHRDWLPMNNSKHFLVNSVRFCRLQGGAMAGLSHDFEAFCPSVLQSSVEPNQYWVSVMEIQPKAQGATPFLRMRLNALWNPTKVSTP